MSDDNPGPQPPPPPPQALLTAIAVLRGVDDSYGPHEKSEAADQLEVFLHAIQKSKRK